MLTLDVEPACWRTFTAATGEPVTLKPDLCVVTADHDTETHSFVEVDLGSEHLPVLLRKCRTYQRYFQTGSEQTAHDLFPAIVWVVPTQQRRDKLRQAITSDRHLDPGLFWIVTPDQALRQLAPYERTPNQ